MNLADHKILIVEDEIIVAMEMELELEACGYNVVGKANSYKSAMDISIKNSPDIVLMDVNLKGEKNGIETAKEITSCSNAYFIFISAYTDEETKESISSVANSYFLPKPFTTNDLLKKIEEVISLMKK